MSKHKTKKPSTTILGAWWQAARPPFYIATLIPVFLGFSLAGKDSGTWDKLGLLGIMFICLLLHLAANLANDLFDHLLGVDTEQSIGGSRVIQQGKITPRALAIAITLLYTATIICTFAGVAYFGLPKLWFVTAFAMFSSFFYVAPPIRYGHKALGEVFVFFNMGLAMTAGTYYALTGQVTGQIISFSLPVGLMVAGILYYQSMPEIELDKAAGKNTLANTLGGKNSITLLYAWWPAVWTIMLGLFASGQASWIILLGIITSLPFYFKLIKIVRSSNGDWLSLDQHGHLVRKIYLLCGLSLIFSVLF